MRSTESWRQSHSPSSPCPVFSFNRRVFTSLWTINTRTHCRCRYIRIDTCINKIYFVLVSRIWRKTATRLQIRLSLYRALRSLLAENQKSLIFDSMSGMIRNQCTSHYIWQAQIELNFFLFSFWCVWIRLSIRSSACDCIFCIIFYVIQFVRWWWCLTSGRWFHFVTMRLISIALATATSWSRYDRTKHIYGYATLSRTAVHIQDEH